MNFLQRIKSLGHKQNPGELHSIARVAASKFDNEEIALLQMTWQDLADRSKGKGIDKETFLQYFPLNGLLGERLFVQFDNKHTGFIDFDDFIIGLATVCRGSLDDKIHFIFNMYDISHANTVSKQELSTLLNHIPKAMLQNHVDWNNNGYNNGYESNSSYHGSDYGSEKSIKKEEELEEVDQYTNHDLIEKAFDECDINHKGRLSYEEFKMWVERNPSVLEYIESILPYHEKKESHLPHAHKDSILPHRPSRSRQLSAYEGNSSHGISSRTHSLADVQSLDGSQRGRLASRSNSRLGNNANASNGQNIPSNLSLSSLQIDSSSSSVGTNVNGSSNNNGAVSSPSRVASPSPIHATRSSSDNEWNGTTLSFYTSLLSFFLFPFSSFFTHSFFFLSFLLSLPPSCFSFAAFVCYSFQVLFMTLSAYSHLFS